MRRVLLVAIGVCLVGMATYLLSHTDGQPPGEVLADESSGSGEPMEDGVSDAGVVATLDVEEKVPAVERETLPDPTMARITGRLVAAETEKPLVGTVDLRSIWNSDRGFPSSERPDWRGPDEVTTGADGRFALLVPGHPAYSYTITARAKGRTTMVSRQGEVGPGEQTDLGDALMSAGTAVRGRLVDEQGAAVAGSRLSFNQDRLRRQFLGKWSVESQSSIVTAADGTFVLEEALVSGAWRLAARDMTLVDPEQIHLAEGQPYADLEVVVQRPEILTGVIGGLILDEAGEPVPGVFVETRKEDGSRAGTGRSGRDGSFVIEQRSEYTGSLLLTINGASYEQLGGPLEQRWGDRDVRIVVREYPTLRLRVVEAVTGIPIEDYGIRIYRGEPGSVRAPLAHQGHHENGELEIPHRAPGLHRVHVIATDETYVPTEPLEIRVEGTQPEVQVEVQRRIPVPVRVELLNGSPVGGTSVELIRVEGRGSLAMSTITGTPEDAYTRFSSTGALGVILDEGTTDGQGSINLSGPDSGALVLKVKGPGHIPRIHEDLRGIGGADPIVVRVSKGATVIGVVEPRSFVQKMLPSPDLLRSLEDMSDERRQERLQDYGPRLALRPSDRTAGVQLRVHLDGDGRFSFEGIPPGDCEVVFLSRRMSGGFDIAKSDTLEPIIGLQDGETRELHLDLSHLDLGVLNGRVRFDGQVYRGQLSLWRASPSDEANGRVGQSYARGLSPDEFGAFRLNVDPGLYRVAIDYRDEPSGEERRILNSEPAMVDAGSTVDHVFDVVRSTLRLRVLESDGIPATERILEFIPSDYPLPRTPLTPDADGWFTLVVAAGVPVQFSTWPRGKDERTAAESLGSSITREALAALRVDVGTFKIPVGEAQAEFEVTLPPGK